MQEPPLTSTDSDYTTFVKECIDPLSKKLEKRRRRYLKYFSLLSISAIILVIALLTNLSTVESQIFQFLSRLDTLGENNSPALNTTITNLLLYMVTPCVLIYGVLFPIRHYRKHVKSLKVGDGLILETPFQLKNQIFSKLFSFFGEFKIESDHQISLLNLHGNRILPEYDHIYSEDRITGNVHESKIEIAEAKLIKDCNGKNIAVFGGLFVIIDICNPDIKLRGNFQGETVLIQDARKHSEHIEEKYQDFECIPLNNQEFEALFEGYGTAPEESARLLSDPFLMELKQLANTISQAKEQMTHSDSKFTDYVTSLVRYTGEFLYSWLCAVPLSILYFIRTRRFGLVRYNRPQPFIPQKHTELLRKVGYEDCQLLEQLNEGIECNFFKDKALITIPYSHDLFEPNSLFEPPLVKEDASLVFHLMKTVETLTATIIESK